MSLDNNAKRYICELPNGGFRDCSEDEIAAALVKQQHGKTLYDTIARCEKELSEIMKNCDHSVSYDRPGFPYDVRTCVICGHQSTI